MSGLLCFGTPNIQQPPHKEPQKHTWEQKGMEGAICQETAFQVRRMYATKDWLIKEILFILLIFGSG